MGSEDFYPEERPVHETQVGGFWMDHHPVTVGEFRGSSRPPGTSRWPRRSPTPRTSRTRPRAAGARLAGVQSTPGPVSLDDFRAWWAWVPGAQWRHPEGPGSTLHGLERHPVTHVALRRRASPTRTWAGKALPDRGGVGVRRARWPRGSHLRVGRRVRAARPHDGQHLAGRLPGAQRPARRLRAHLAGRHVPAQRLRPRRRDRQRLGVDQPGLHQQPRRPTPAAHVTPRPAAARPCCGPHGARPAHRHGTADGRSRPPRSSRAAHTCARPTTACATARRRGRPDRRHLHQPPRASAASSAP